MPGFSLTPLGLFPPPAPDDFPVGLLFQNSGTDLGDRAVDTVNFRRNLNATRGTAETANVVTVDAAAFSWRDVTDAYLVTGDDLGNGLKVNVASAGIITVPGDDELGLAVADGDVSMLIMQDGSGGVSIFGQSGVTVNVRAELAPLLAGRYAVVSLLHTGPNEWVLCGDLATA